MYRSTLTLALVLALCAPPACSDDDNQSQNNNVGQDATVQNDAETQNDAEVQPDAGPTVQGCTGDPITTAGPLGSCCNTSDDCELGTCLGGWCSQNCSDDSDCEPAAPGPFVTGTPMHCNTSPFGLSNWCLPGSLQDCGADGNADCPTGEICVGGLNDDAADTTNGLRGICVTTYAQPGTLAPGESVQDSPNDPPYQCQTPTYWFTGTFGRRCSQGCDPTNPNNTCPAGMHCTESYSLRTNEGIFAGIGVCASTECGRAEFTGDDENDVRIPGLDADCPTGEFCQAWWPLSPDGNVVGYFCGLSDPSLGQIGDPCEHSLKFDLGCDNDLYCIQSAAEYDINGATCPNDDACATDEVCVDHYLWPSRCAPKPDPGVCSTSCRTDADCPNLESAPSYCIRQEVDMTSNGDGYITFCLPWSSISDDPEVQCDTNADCDLDVGAGCVSISSQSDHHFCLPHISQDTTGADCATNGVADCQAGEACVEDPDAQTFLCTQVLAFGDPCDPTDTNRCVGGNCVDIEFEEDDNGATTNTFCAGWCVTNADCDSNQVCDWDLLAENDPATDADDVTGTFCRPMTVRMGAGCTVPGDCTNGDGCDVTTGRCYTTTATWGDGCASHSDCPQYGLCDQRVAGGLCYRPGCDPANGNGDCDGTGACSDALAVGMCLEDCTTTTDCDRAGFTCVNGACLAP